ncbi:MAG: phosphoadenosine phosphosulfate reductase family protein, partial [Hyphomonadaceae bacterium]
MQSLRELEAEAIHILREAAAAFSRPLLMFSIGKDSMVLLHLAAKAFAPGPIPFPLLHIDTTWKFKEMISFRDRIARQYGVELIVHTNLE